MQLNHTLILYIEELYKSQHYKGDITLKALGKGIRLFSQNEKSNKVYFLINGIVKCYFYEENDKEYIIEFLGKGEVTGEIEAIKNNPCLCNVETITNVNAYQISHHLFKTLLKKELRFNHLLVDILTERVINTSSRASFQQTYTIKHRLKELLKLLSDQELSISKEDMAAYLGINIRSLNRAFKDLK